MSDSSMITGHASGGRLSAEGMNARRCLSDNPLTESRSSGQVVNGTPPTSPPYWDSDDDDDCGPRPSALYGKFTWKIEKFSQITKRELRSNAFIVGGYKWYILIYPQGCDVCNHLSLFLCVADHDKLLPGWSHFAQFTIAVVNRDPTKSKYSDTLHRFSKKEHDWGWKKFIELSKVLEGFINDDSLVIKAQVQVIREKADRPFRCLDCQYRRELVRVYLSNVEQICRRFIEERKGKFSSLIEDKVRWSSFRAFWLGIDQITRRCMSRDKTDTILRIIVKHFFVEKEVTSTLVMDSLYSGLKALECHSKNGKGKTKMVDMEEFPAPLIHIENDMFVLVDDILLLLERVALGPVPLQPLTPKDEKGSQNRTKDSSTGEEFSKDTIERDERRLTEFGRRILEFFVIAHIFSSRIEVAYQEAIALKRQEELIREEEEAAEQAENELRAKRSAADKEKRAKKKQAKQKRNSRKVKDKTKDMKSDMMMQEKCLEQARFDCLLDECSTKQEVTAQENAYTSDSGDDVAERIQPHLNLDTNASGINFTHVGSKTLIQNGQTGKGTPSVIDDSCSTCSTDSISLVLENGSCEENHMQGSKSATDRTPEPETKAVLSSNNRREQYSVDEIEVLPRQKEQNMKHQVDSEQSSSSRTSDTASVLGIPGKASYAPPPNQSPEIAVTTTTSRASTSTVDAVTVKESKATILTRSQVLSYKPEVEKNPTPPKSIVLQEAASISRPSSAPLIPARRRTAPVVAPTVEATPFLSRSVSATGRLGTEPSASAPPFIPQSYRNAITGKNDTTAAPLGFIHPPSNRAFVSVALPPQTATWNYQASVLRGLTFGSLKQDALQRQYQLRDECSHLDASSSCSSSSSIREVEVHCELHARKQYPGEATSNFMSLPQQVTVSDEFPHLDIINDLLDEDRSSARTAASSQNGHPQHQRQHQLFHRRYSFSGDADISGSNFRSTGRDQPEHYYNDGVFQRMDGSASSSPIRGPREGQYSQLDLLAAYSNGQVPGVHLQNQWPYSAPDLSMLSLGSRAADVSSFSYQLPDYSDGVNGYAYSRPGNGPRRC